jgi:hypothetical protein
MASMADLVTEVPTLSLPTRMQYRFREITKIGKTTVPITPSIGQAPVKAGDTIIVELPFNTVIDLTTFIMEFDGETTDNGKIHLVHLIIDKLDFSLVILLQLLNN